MHTLIIQLRTLTLTHTYKIANKVIKICSIVFFNNFVIMFQLAKNGLEPVARHAVMQVV